MKNILDWRQPDWQRRRQQAMEDSSGIAKRPRNARWIHPWPPALQSNVTPGSRSLRPTNTITLALKTVKKPQVEDLQKGIYIQLWRAGGLNHGLNKEERVREWRNHKIEMSGIYLLAFLPKKGDSGEMGMEMLEGRWLQAILNLPKPSSTCPSHPQPERRCQRREKVQWHRINAQLG